MASYMNEVTLSEMLDEMNSEEFEASESIIGKRLWTPRLGSTHLFNRSLFTDAQLVDCFLETTKLWYNDPSNSLYRWREEVRAELIRWREEVRAELIRCLAENDDADEPHQLVYAHMKFHSEWVGPDGMFTEYKNDASINFEDQEDLE